MFSDAEGSSRSSASRIRTQSLRTCRSARLRAAEKSSLHGMEKTLAPRRLAISAVISDEPVSAMTISSTMALALSRHAGSSSAASRMHGRSLGDCWRAGHLKSGCVPMFEEALKEAVPIDERHDGAELRDYVFGSGAVHIGIQEKIPEVRAVQSLEGGDSLGHGGPIALELRGDPPAIGGT